MATRVLLMGVLLLLERAAAVCLKGRKYTSTTSQPDIYHHCNKLIISDPNPTENALTVSVECLQSGLSITWQKRSGAGYHAEVNYVCTDSYGNIVSSSIGVLHAWLGFD